MILNGTVVGLFWEGWQKNMHQTFVALSSNSANNCYFVNIDNMWTAFQNK